LRKKGGGERESGGGARHRAWELSQAFKDKAEKEMTKRGRDVSGHARRPHPVGDEKTAPNVPQLMR